jgi:RNA polymerase sigma-70 factor (ECF subfamily)
MLPFSRTRAVLTEPCGLGYAQLLRLEDEELMQHLALGHDDALAVLYDRHRRLVLGIAMRVLRDASEAQDVSQDVFIKLHRTVAQFDPAKGMTRMWVVRLAYQLSLNRRRYLALRSQHASGAEFESREPVLPGSDARLPPAEAARLVRQLLAQLGDRQRRTIEMACFDGLTMNEIAATTGESVGNVRHHYYRGIAKLKALLAERPALAAASEGEVGDGPARQMA